MKLSSGTVHKIPKDLIEKLSSPKVSFLWEDITPLARNEYICWVTSAKKEGTRGKRIRRVYEDLLKGKRRPCCWAGCVHRK